MLETLRRKTKEGIRYTDDEITASKADPVLREEVLTGLYNFMQKYYKTKIDENFVFKEDLIEEACDIMLIAYNTWRKDIKYKDNDYSFYIYLVGTLFLRLPAIKNTKYGSIIVKPYLTKAYIRKKLTEKNISFNEEDDLFLLWNNYFFQAGDIDSLDQVISRDDEDGHLTYHDVIGDKKESYCPDPYYTRKELRDTLSNFIMEYSKRNKLDVSIYNTIQSMLNNTFVSITDSATKEHITGCRAIKNFGARLSNVLKRIKHEFIAKGN